MKTLLLVVTMLAEAVHPQTTDTSGSDGLEQWQLFKVRQAKNYGSEREEEERRKIFLNNLVFIKEHNAKYERGETTFNVEINKFADLTAKEFSAMMNGYKNPEDGVPSVEVFQKPADLELPNTVDWREEGAVTRVKDQGQCNCCWAFSATGSLEGQNFIKTRELVSLSEQNLMDCSGPQGTKGCNGGGIDQAFTYVILNNGIDTEDSYPYESQEGPCRYDVRDKGATVSGYRVLPSGSEDDLQAAVASVGPISAAMDASQPSFQFYRDGVYHDADCSKVNLDHGVVLVGYGSDPMSGDYWMVKNSWGTSWGNGGYFMLARNRGNMCGIATAATYPLV